MFKTQKDTILSKRKPPKMLVIYRISDAGYNKVKPSYINNESCLANATATFKNEEWLIIADNISNETYSMICKYHPEQSIKKVSVGNGAGTFNLALDTALKRNKEDIIYFLENDYLHKPGAAEIIHEGFQTGHSFISLYDHPDKYLNPEDGGNPFCENRSEKTSLYLTNSCHWKISNSTTMTFASKASTINKTIDIMRKHTTGTHPFDFQMFLELAQKGHKLVTSVPGFSTHGETKWLSPLTNWQAISQQFTKNETQESEPIEPNQPPSSTVKQHSSYKSYRIDPFSASKKVIQDNNIKANHNSMALDLGCGSKPRNPFAAESVFGVDIVNSRVENAVIFRADLNHNKIPFGDSIFDYCTAYDFLEHIPRTQTVRSRLTRKPKTDFPFIRVMNEIYRVLAPGGYFLHSTPAYPAKQAFQDPTHVNIITEDTFPAYFCTHQSEGAWASMYGFTGAFTLVEQVWACDTWIVSLLKSLKE